MANFSNQLTLHFSEEGSGFSVTVEDLETFIKEAKARGAESSDEIIPELDNHDELNWFTLYLSPFTAS
ncbi:hypothetical protein [Arthrobacter cryoconiti]|uniref:Uncharacterized protein n=1 Tax=Arthrobacter cryoconiti TaxID=748907 RepID=A0ABV8QXY2_9MICC|nr:hypothetical protein [Arthrobacter cryoconiti]MCC9068825.1 hypothetical protein [Arthrobacter cryoconiti]